MSSTTSHWKVDLHVHSEHSDSPYSWFLRSSRAAECYTAVERVYDTAKRRGMDLVTLADHDTIDGSLELCSRHPDDSFVSVEVSARFPEDGCIIHLIAVDIDERQHRELQALRPNVYELVGYLHREQIGNFWCHPLSQVNGRLTREHLERGLLMFRALEIRNGTRDTAHERGLLEVISRLTPAMLESWADRHPRAPFCNRDGRYALVGGSDDHGSLAIARAYTTFRGELSGAGLAEALRTGLTAPGGEPGTGTTLAHNCYGVLAGYLHAHDQRDLGGARHGAAQPPVSSSILTALIDAQAPTATPGPMVQALWNTGHLTQPQEMMRAAAELALSGSWRKALDGIIEPVRSGHLGVAADGVPALLRTLALELPYLLAHRYHVRDRRGADRFATELGACQLGKTRPRVAVFTDTIDHVNGVAIGLRRLLREARRDGVDLKLVGCAAVPRLTVDDDGIYRLPSVFEHRLAEYPEMAWSVPHLPPLLRFLEEEDIDLIQCSTPGPVGLAALAAGRLAGLPVIGQYHTDVPEYALRLTGDPVAGALVRQVVGWFYRAMDRVLVPTEWVGDVVRGLGVAPEHLVRIPRGIDLELFSPSLRDPEVVTALGLGDGPVLLYVGRLSREKSIDLLLAAFAAVHAELPAARLLLVGDGPLRAELERNAPPGCVLTGFITGEPLATLYASADIFVFPSETETFGNVVVEAQASGLPAIVSDRGATREHVVDGTTGYTVDPRDLAATARAILRLARDGELRRRMSRAAVQHATRYDMGDALRGTYRCYGRIVEELRVRPRLDAARPTARDRGMVA